MAVGLFALLWISSLGTAARAQALNPQVLTGVTGRDVALIRGPLGAKVYLFAVTPRVVIKTFDVATGVWEPGALQAPQTDGLYVGWGGAGYAVDELGRLHVAWSERGPCECPDLATPGFAGIRLKHVAYGNGGWAPVETLLERNTGDAICFYHHVHMASDHNGRLVIGYLAGATDSSQHRGYVLFDGSSWSGDHVLTPVKGDLGAGGAAGSLFLGYHVPEGGGLYSNAVVEIPPSTSQPSQPEAFGIDDVSFTHVPRAPVFAFSGSDEVHMVWSESCGPSWYDCRLLYNHRSGGVWDTPGGGTKLYDAAFFADLQTEDPAHVGLAASDLGPVLVAFSFRNDLYLVSWDGATWAGPTLAGQVTTDVHYPAVATLSPTTFLVAYSDRVGTSGQVYYGVVTLCPAGQTQCGSECADLTSDPAHCGGCDQPCGAGTSCVAGQCVADVSPVDASVDASIDGSADRDAEISTQDGAPEDAMDAASPDGGGAMMDRATAGCSCNGGAAPPKDPLFAGLMLLALWFTKSRRPRGGR